MTRISKAVEQARRMRRIPPVGPIVEPVEKGVDYIRTRRTSLELDHLDEQRVIGAIQDKVIIDAYKLLRTRVMKRMQQNNWRTLGITSSGPNEGKSLTSINLALSIAMKHDSTVMLVDADLRRPSILKILGIESKYGLTDYLWNDTPLDEILVNPGIERLVVLPGLGSAMILQGLDDSSELLASPRMVQLVDELRTRYASRVVLFDLPPVLVGDDAVAFLPHLDAALLVVEDGKTQAGELAHSIQLLEDVEIIGTVLNKGLEVGKQYDYYY